MVKNPITTVIGIIVAICPIVGSLFPEAKAICEQLTAELIGLGFIASADGIKKPAIPAQALGSFVIGFLLIVGLTSCAQLKQAAEALNPLSGSIKSVIAENATGEYTVSVEKDGKVLYEKKILCTKNEKELTGCREIQ